MLDIANLHAGYSGNEVLHGVSLNVAEGEMVAIIGPNGAGKSTLLNCISGLLPNNRGTIKLAGNTSLLWHPGKIEEEKIQVLPQHARVFADVVR